MSLLSICVLFLTWFALWNGKYSHGIFERSTESFLLCIVPLILLAILVSAFLKLSKLPDLSCGRLSKKQVAVMLVSNGTYAIFLPLTVFFPPTRAGWAMYTALIVFSYSALLLGLIQVTYMMCKLVDI